MLDLGMADIRPFLLWGVLLLIFLVFPTNVFAADYFVSKNGNNAGGTSWSTAWNELDQINWGLILAGDTIYLDGGATSMTYTTILYPAASGTSGNPITIKLSAESGRNGQVIIDGGRLSVLPECGQATYPPYPNADAVETLAQGVRWDGVSYVVLDGTKWEGISIHGATYGMRFYNDSSNITVKNVEIYDNGSVNQADDGASLNLWYSDAPGIRVEGSGHVFERVHVHDNGQDGMQSGGSIPNNLDSITITESWFENTRIHSGTDNSPIGDSPDELGAPSQGPNYNGYEESFNWCRHSDGFQVFNGGDVLGLTFVDSIFGPGFTNTFMLGDTSGGGATIKDLSMDSVLIIKGSDNNINGKDGLNSHNNWNLKNITVYSPNTKSNGIRIFGANHHITNSIFYGGNVFFENSLVTDNGNCVFDTTGDVFGSFFSNPIFTNATDDAFSLGDYKVATGSSCIGKGSSITSTTQFLALVNAVPTPTPSPTKTCYKADIDEDGIVDLADRLVLLADFFTGAVRSDLNMDGIVDVTDYSLFVKDLGKVSVC